MGENFVFCLIIVIIVVIFIRLGRAYKLGGILNLSNGERGQATKGWDHFYG